MKKLIRVTVKLLATPLFLIWIMMMLATGYAWKFADWAWERSDFEKGVTRDTHQHFVDIFKQWFTQL